jgi:hypothetical protein
MSSSALVLRLSHSLVRNTLVCNSNHFLMSKLIVLQQVLRVLEAGVGLQLHGERFAVADAGAEQVSSRPSLCCFAVSPDDSCVAVGLDNG